MTDEQINETIAMYLGWKGIVSDPSLGVMGVPPTGNECDIPRIKNAMWTKDLNAMHEAEKVLGNRLGAYGELLCEMTVANEPDFAECYIWHATARQRAEAFLRTLGKWEATDKESLTVQDVGWPPPGTRCSRMNADGKWEEVQG